MSPLKLAHSTTTGTAPEIRTRTWEPVDRAVRWAASVLPGAPPAMIAAALPGIPPRVVEDTLLHLDTASPAGSGVSRTDRAAA
jgi:hypothetical protein